MTRGELAALIVETGQHHHHAYIEADSEATEWPLFYADFILTNLAKG